MSHLNLEITRKCNQSCFYCFNNSGIFEKTRIISFESWQTISGIMMHESGLKSDTSQSNLQLPNNRSPQNNRLPWWLIPLLIVSLIIPPTLVAAFSKDSVFVHFKLWNIEYQFQKGDMPDKQYPEQRQIDLKPYMESAKSLLPSLAEDEALKVTVLARMYVEQTGLSLSKNNTDHGNAVEMNKLLIEKGLQVKNPNLKSKKDGQPQYLPTESGKLHSKMIFQQGQDNNKTVQQLRWYPSVLKVLV